MTSKHPPFLLVALLAIAVMAAGCGGDDDSNNSATAKDGSGAAEEPVTTSSLSKAQYVKQAEAICTRSREERIDALDVYREENPEKLENEDSAGEGFEGSIVDVYLPMKEEEVAELRELGAPAGDEARIEEMIVSFEKWLDAAMESGGQATKEVNRYAIQAGNLAGNYGMIECTYG